MSAHTYDITSSEYPHLGQTVIGKTCYQVYGLPSRKEAGIEFRCVLVGPKGSQIMVTDYGQPFVLNAVCLGGGVSWQAAPRKMRGITRAHLSLFMEAAR